MNKFLLFLFCPLLFSISACAGLKLSPPGLDKQSVLVLPVDVVNEAQIKRHGFYYIYKIERLDTSSTPYEAIFKLPIDGNMLIVDSLPAGDYAVKEFKFLPIGTGNATYGNNIEERNDKFKLEPGKITLFQKSLNVLMFNETVGRSMSTIYDFDMYPVSTLQKQEILATLKAQPNFSSWKLQNDLPTIGNETQGEWIAYMKPTTDVNASGTICNEGAVYWEIDRSNLVGKAVFDNEIEYRIFGKVENIGTVFGSYYLDGDFVGKFSGRYTTEKQEGTYRDPDNCEGSWQATRGQRPKKPPLDAFVASESLSKIIENPNVPKLAAIEELIPPEGITGAYISSIQGTDLGAFTKKRNVKVKIEQIGNKISGRFDPNGIIEGQIENSKIIFTWETAIGRGHGEWYVSDSTSDLTGTWSAISHPGDGNWDLKFESAVLNEKYRNLFLTGI